MNNVSTVYGLVHNELVLEGMDEDSIIVRRTSLTTHVYATRELAQIAVTKLLRAYKYTSSVFEFQDDDYHRIEVIPIKLIS